MLMERARRRDRSATFAPAVPTTRAAAFFLALALAALGPGGSAAASYDADHARRGEPAEADTDLPDAPWFEDVNGHWAARYIRVLWEERVIAEAAPGGGVSPDLWGDRDRRGNGRNGPLFHPDANIIPSDFGGMLVRVFPGGRFLPAKVALDLADSGRALGQTGTAGGGWVSASGGGSQRRAGARGPSVFLRQDAVGTLIEALGLGEFARALDPRLAEAYLRQFRDARDVWPGFRQTLALAVRLGLIEGYPDRTLMPRRPLTRAEGATLVYRSCLLLTDAEPNPFSPDGDGVDDETTFYLGSLRNRNARGWDLLVLDSRGAVLRRLGPGAIRGSGSGAEPVPPDAPDSSGPPPSAAWDGKDDRGVTLPPGVYYYRGWLKDRKNLTHWSVLKPVIIEDKTLRGFARPSFLLPGQTVHLSAWAGGGPSAVTARLSRFPAAGRLPLEADGERRVWQRDFVVPAWAEPGQCVVSFTADYGRAVRTAVAVFEIGRLAVDGKLEPNPVAAGRTVRVTAWPNLAPDNCEAAFALPCAAGPNALITLPLAATDGGRRTWTGNLVVPADTPPGRYPVIITARLAPASASAELWLEVVAADAALTYILSD